ncbi:MAG: class I SAM-dependent methyltransferase [Flavobacteriales bacterium]|nr:class I SAM-dependent methyltransferase [Flavobacteriales bacterium]
MGIQLQRKKQKHLLLSIFYRLSKIPWISNKFKLKLFLDLAWIFERLAHSSSVVYYKAINHPGRLGTWNFLSKFISEDYLVLDLGCSSGDLTNIISKKVKKIDGIDHDITSINHAKMKYAGGNISFIHDDALQYLQNLSFKYDMIIMSHVLEHIDNPKNFIKGYTPFTSYFYIEVPDFEKTYHNIYRKDVGCKLIHTDDDHVAEFDREEMEEIFNELNLSIIAQELRFGVMKFILKTNNEQ